MLTPDERLRYLTIPPDISEWALGTFFTLTPHDIEIINRHRRDYNRLGFAVQLCVLRYLGWTLSDVNAIPSNVLSYIAGQINVKAREFDFYSKRDATNFILDYISSESMRRRIQKGLNKGEAMNALARAIFFGKQGDFRERALQDQLQRASALNILINAICVWNTVYLTEATKHLKMTEKARALLPHVSPLAWEHINFLGEYTFDLGNTTTLESLRPLKSTTPHTNVVINGLE